MHKGEWNGVLSDNSFAEIRAGQYGYDWDNGVNGDGLRYEDIGNNLITGRNRNWARERRRDQVLGTFSYFKSGWAGDHNFKIGGEIFRRDREGRVHRRLRGRLHARAAATARNST